MRAELPGARTWLLGGVALWALATWVLGLVGLGGRIERLPPDPALLQALPAVPRPGDDRLGPLAQYDEFGDRPLFTTDRRPQPFVLNPVDEDAPAEFDFVLTSVLLTPGLEVAIVQPAAGGESVRMKAGEANDAVPGWRLVSVAPRSAVFEGPEGPRTLELRVFNGIGGEAPTAMSTPPPAAARPAEAAAGVRPRAAGANSGAAAAGARPVVVTTSSQPAPTEIDVPEPGTAPAEPAPAPAPAPQRPAEEQPSVRTSEQQVDAIRQRIEARRARLREQAQRGQQGQ